MATSFSGGGSRSTRREPPTMGRQLLNFITCDCKSSAPFFVIYKAHAVLVIGLYVELWIRRKLDLTTETTYFIKKSYIE
jgi:hypothetical protein